MSLNCFQVPVKSQPVLNPCLKSAVRCFHWPKTNTDCLIHQGNIRFWFLDYGFWLFRAPSELKHHSSGEIAAADSLRSLRIFYGRFYSCGYWSITSRELLAQLSCETSLLPAFIFLLLFFPISRVACPLSAGEIWLKTWQSGFPSLAKFLVFCFGVVLIPLGCILKGSSCMINCSY